MTDSDKRKPEQLPLTFSHEAAQGRDDLVVSGPLSAATSLIDRWPDWPSPLVILVGPPGSGKTHLAEIWRRTASAARLGDQGADEAVRMAEDAPVLIEDVDRNGYDETLLFHMINAVRSHGRSLLMTARSRPSSWGVVLPDLMSRLKAATLVEIGPPDDALLTQVLFKLFADRQLMIDEKLAAYIVGRMERSLAAAQTIVDRLDRLALARGAKLSRALAAEVLKDETGDA
ncbi:chromosomal replication initiation ATPase DnaA [Rhizobium sp. SG_E_25_P2]|uniref:DnaA regulatory inactivator HdaA n=1 Tax=Rhizobium sp. SG_E_25_P2 TaxID=2879942 RepID=UPI00247426FF|nr:DnaA regulatory inactivator HdaA [Rhizobium sp. SG_E_25_P2]MDH6266745.1 chromosomal replication initiation ATPase DnaA [Rhizobium sp. SG_E_25_P2]